MTYDIYDFVGNGIVSGFRYGEAVKEITPYLDGVTKLGLRYNALEGIEDMRRYEKSLDFQGFFAIERQCGHQNIFHIKGFPNILFY